MIQSSRRQFMKYAGAASASVISGAPTFSYAQTPQFKLKLGDSFPESHPMNVRAKEAADAIRRETNGRVDLQIFANAQLGSDNDMLSQARSGALELYLCSQNMANLTLVGAIHAVPFAFKNYDQVWAAIDGDLGHYVREQIGKVGLVAMDKVWDNGFRQITTSTKPVNSPADLQNLKIRVAPSPISFSVFKALGASTITVNFAEAYSALQTKVIEAQENGLVVIEQSRFYEVQKYCSMTSHMWDGFNMVANAKIWNSMPKDLQAIVARNLNAASMAERADIAAAGDRLEGELKAKGLIFNRPDIAPFREILQKAGFYSEWKEKFGAEAWGLLEKYAGKLT